MEEMPSIREVVKLYFDGLTGIILGKQREPIWGRDIHYNEGYIQGVKEKDERQ
jgi:hypothetical protein